MDRQGLESGRVLPGNWLGAALESHGG